MLCQNCGKKEANVNYTQIINGVKKEMHLCNACSKEMGIEELDFNMPISFSNFFGDIGNMLEGYENFMPNIVQNKIQNSCPNCRMTYDEFLALGKFGCEECYDVFQDRIDPILKNIHGNSRHVGRNSKLLGVPVEKQEISPKTKPKQKEEIEVLKERLKEEIKEERYEDAAKTRDAIKKIEERKEN